MKCGTSFRRLQYLTIDHFHLQLLNNCSDMLYFMSGVTEMHVDKNIEIKKDINKHISPERIEAEVELLSSMYVLLSTIDYIAFIDIPFSELINP